MEESLTLVLPRKDVEVLLRVLDQIRLISEAEQGEAEIDKGKYLALDQLKEKQRQGVA